jgi:integrase
MLLTDLACRQAKSEAKQYKMTDTAGLYLLVKSSGKYWRWNYRYGGKRKTMALGVYPAVTLAAARTSHSQHRKILAGGLDPMVAKRQVENSAALTFEAVARQWHKHWSPSKTPKHADYVIRRLEADVFPQIGQIAIGDIPASAFRDTVKKIESRGALDIAKRALQTCGQIMRYAVAHDLTASNPINDIRPADILKTRKKRHYPSVDEKELPKLLQAIDHYNGGQHTRLALMLLAVTFVRTNELIRAKWDEFDLLKARWNIPGERMKMRTPHIVPLSKQAIAILNELKAIAFGSEWVLPGDIDTQKCMSNNTILYALYRMGYHGRMTGHGFRSVASTILHEQGWPHEHIELQLAHQERDDTSAAYNHALYLVPRAKMMQAYSDLIDALRSQPT